MANSSAVPARVLSNDNSGLLFEPGSARFLRLADVRNRVGYGRATIYRLIAAGQFPRQYSLGARAVAWLESEVDAWIATRVEAAQMQQGNAPARSTVR